MQDAIQQVQARCLQVVQTAKEKYGVDLSNVQVRFDLRGRAAGQAMRKNGVYIVRFNRDMLTRDAFNHVLKDTVPHEYAHIMCFMDPTRGGGHDYGWARVCIALGGSGATCHREEVVYGKGNTYEYTTTAGHKVRLSQIRHRRIQQGGRLLYRGGKGEVNRTCAFSIVGQAGVSLAAPVVPTTSGLPAAMVQRMTHIETLPRNPAQNTAQPSTWQGSSKAAVSREIMSHGYQNGWDYEKIITEMQRVNGYDRQLARGTFKANAPKIGIPATFC